MCIAIINTTGILDEATFHNCWDNNPHGGGIAYVDNGEVRVFKEMESVDDLYREYTHIRKHNALPILLHFRVATSGDIDEDNCHPFEVFPGLVVAHNGIIDNVKATPSISDTRIFIDQVLSKLPDNFLYNDGIRQLIGGYIERSRLVFLNRHGIYDIINEYMGHWDDEHLNWFSNNTYEKEVHTTKYLNSQSDYHRNHAYHKKYSFNQYDQDELASCECCGNVFDTSELIYDARWQAAFCEACHADFAQDESLDIR